MLSPGDQFDLNGLFRDMIELVRTNEALIAQVTEQNLRLTARLRAAEEVCYATDRWSAVHQVVPSFDSPEQQAFEAAFKAWKQVVRDQNTLAAQEDGTTDDPGPENDQVLPISDDPTGSSS